MKRLETIAIATFLGFAITGCSSKAETVKSETITMTTSSEGVQKAIVKIAGGKYNPSIVSVQKGKPVELTFAGGDELGCGGTVVFKSLNMSKDVQSGQTVIFNFTPEQAGDIPFTCGMGMYDGKVVVK